MASPRTHFISVSRRGELFARRIGAAPVRITAAGEPLVLTVPERPELADLRVHFSHTRATPRRSVHVTAVELAGLRLPVDEFQARHHVGDDELGQWMRAAIDRILDRA